MTDINIKKVLFERQAREIEDDILPFGIIDDGSNAMDEYDREDKLQHIRDQWQIPMNHDF